MRIMLEILKFFSLSSSKQSLFRIQTRHFQSFLLGKFPTISRRFPEDFHYIIHTPITECKGMSNWLSDLSESLNGCMLNLFSGPFVRFIVSSGATRGKDVSEVSDIDSQDQLNQPTFSI